MIEQESPPPATRSKAGMRGGMTLISIGLIATTLGTATSIGELPLTSVLMNQLGCNAEQVSRFFWLMTIPWAFKPLAGLLSDSIPPCGTRRRHYILLASAVAAGLWFVLAWVTARSTPKGSEALGYGLIMAVWSNVQQFAPWFGSALNQHFGVTLGALIWINVVVALALVALVPLMPRAIMNRREGEH